MEWSDGSATSLPTMARGSSKMPALAFAILNGDVILFCTIFFLFGFTYPKRLWICFN
jgi:hypothetical protein